MKKNKLFVRVALLVALSLLLCCTLAYAAIPTITIIAPSTYNVYNPTSGTYVAAKVYNNTSTPTLSFNGTSLGSMTYDSANSWYYFWWKPTTSQKGLGVQALKQLTVTAAGSSGGSSGNIYTYVSEADSSLYNANAWNWTIIDTANQNYNCLGYALGTNTRVWPWVDILNNGYNPTISQVNTYMDSMGYKPCTSSDAVIIAYGTTSSVGHFAKKTGSNYTKSKWGVYELMSHNALDPYTSTGTYKNAVGYYKYK